MVVTTRHWHPPPYAPAVSNGGRWSAAAACAERDDLMPGLPHPGMRVVCARFSKIISGHPSASLRYYAPFEYIITHYARFAYGGRRLFEQFCILLSFSPFSVASLDETLLESREIIKEAAQFVVILKLLIRPEINSINYTRIRRNSIKRFVDNARGSHYVNSY